MTTNLRTRSNVLDLVSAEFGNPRSLGDVVADLDPSQLSRGKMLVARGNIANLLVTSSGLGPTRTAVPHPGLADTPLLSAVLGIDGAAESVTPVTVTFTNAADVTPEGDELPESTLTFTTGDGVVLATVGHHIPVTKQALNHNATLRADIDTYLSGGVLTKLEQLLADELTAGVGVTAYAFDTSLATTVRRAIAAAQGAMRELGPGRVTAVLSPQDHATLDLAVGAGLAQWPADIVSTPALAPGFAYVSRFKQTAQVFATEVVVTLGYVSDQFTRNTVTARATIEALPHLAAPAAIIKADLT